MIGQTSKHSQPELTQSLQNKINHTNKKKHIYKDKSDPQSHEKLVKLSKEQKARIQKQKNREAAQRSRDTHRQYVINLENQVRILRQKVQNSKFYCSRCQKIMSEDQTQNEYNRNVQLEEEVILIKNEISIENQVLENHQQPESYIRLFQPQEESPFLKMMLFVCMIVIGVMVFGNSTQPTTTRVLVQKYEQSALKPIQGELSLASCVQEKGLVQLHKGMQNQKCLDSLMRVQVPSARKSLRSVHENSFSHQMQNIMLCSLRTPQIYPNKSSMLDSPIYRLFVSGSDIKQMGESSESIFRLTDRNIQLNGIYKLKAQIKGVELIPHHSCIV